MRPRNLKVKGFTCFREPIEVDFTGMDVFVISGPTGAGKTTIVDAICYALYGKVPRGTTPKDLIAQDATEMKVQLEFESGGDAYRVHRGYNISRTTVKKTGAEKVSRDLTPIQFERRLGEGWEPLHDRVANVDAAIAEAVGLDFRSFTKCVLLPQGKFAEFLTDDSNERDKILIDLLDLGIYARVMRAANNRAATLDTQIKDRERQLAEDYANATEESLAATREQLATARPLLETERQRRAALQGATEHAATVRRARASAKKSEQDVNAKASELKSAQKTATEAAETLATLQGALEAAETELRASVYDAALHAALVRAEQCAKQAERARLAADGAREASSDRGKVDAAEAAAAAANNELASARAAVAAAETALSAAQRTDVAAHLRSALKPGDPCPVCGGVIGKGAKSEKSTVAAAERALGNARTTEAAAADGAGKAATQLAIAQKSFAVAAEQAASAAAELARAEQDLHDALPDAMPPQLKAIAARLAEQEKARLTHEALRSNSDRVREALDAHREAIAGSERTIAALQAEIAQLDASIAADRAEGDAALAELKTIATAWQWGDVLELIGNAKFPGDLLHDMLETSQRDVEDGTRRIATLEAEEKSIEKAIARARELHAGLAEMKTQHQICRELGILLRADNFQQFVIVEAMQVLAEAATGHLRVLFDRFGIRVEDGEFAVVDHWQADQVRPAKTLSGGETFVASLALALALAEQLPQLRSAAASSLESLFLDEGFGTLDAETLETVIEALEGLRSAERMVGVITHVPELTARIEQRILVRKSPLGSTVEVAGVPA